MSYIKRLSESNIQQPLVEQLQGGYIFRFNEILSQRDNMNGDSITNYNYEEFLFSVLPKIEEVTQITNYELNETQILFIVNESVIISDTPIEQILTLDDLKIKKISDFDPILNEFTLLISRAKIISGESVELNNIIEIIKGVKDSTISNINNFGNIEELSKFFFREEDINNLKNLLKPYLF